MNDSDRRFNDQFRETPYERDERQRNARHKQALATLHGLIADLSAGLADEGPDWSLDGFLMLRKRVANALPSDKCPDWLVSYRDPPMVSS